jgi:hypothetical protein
MAKSHSQKREDEILLRMLKTPPQPRDEMKADEMKAKDKAHSEAPEANVGIKGPQATI